MKSFNEFVKRGIFPFAIHYRNIENIKNIIKEDLDDDDDDKLTGPWLNDKSENGGKSVTTISKMLSGGGANLVDRYSRAHKHILEYTANSAINVALLKGGKLNKKNNTHVNGLFDTIHDLPLRNDLTVWSGIGHDPRHHIDENGMVRSPAFTSATHCKQTALKYAKTNAELQDENREKEGKEPERALHVLQINLRGTNSKNGWGDPAHFIGERSTFSEEHETIISPTTFKYLGTKTHTLHTKDGTPYTVHVHHMEPHRQ